MTSREVYCCQAWRCEERNEFEACMELKGVSDCFSPLRRWLVRRSRRRVLPKQSNRKETRSSWPIWRREERTAWTMLARSWEKKRRKERPDSSFPKQRRMIGIRSLVMICSGNCRFISILCGFVWKTCSYLNRFDEIQEQTLTTLHTHHPPLFTSSPVIHSINHLIPPSHFISITSTHHVCYIDIRYEEKETRTTIGIPILITLIHRNKSYSVMRMILSTSTTILWTNWNVKRVYLSRLLLRLLQIHFQMLQYMRKWFI